MRLIFCFFSILIYSIGFSQTPAKVQIIPKNNEKKIDVMIDGKLFTSYLYSDSLLNKPILFPLNTAQGHSIVKDFIPKTLTEENAVPSGVWLGFGNANGINFWRNADESNAKKFGKVRHTKILKTKGGNDVGGIEVGMEWVKEDGSELLYQNNKYIFRAEGNMRLIDVIITLTPITEPITFTDSDEGFFAINLSKEIGLPITGSDKIKNSSGAVGIDVIGKKAKWIKLSGKTNNIPVTVSVFDHPLNIAYPTFWNIRNDGLLSANPLGLKIFTQGKETANFEIPELNSAIFRYRIIIQSQTNLTDKQINAEYEKFIKLK